LDKGFQFTRPSDGINSTSEFSAFGCRFAASMSHRLLRAQFAFRRSSLFGNPPSLPLRFDQIAWARGKLLVVGGVGATPVWSIFFRNAATFDIFYRLQVPAHLDNAPFLQSTPNRPDYINLLRFWLRGHLHVAMFIEDRRPTA
jgi:hypothetical protein